jgi:hypothetical protein
MHAVMLRDPADEGIAMLRPEAEAWDGTTITSLLQLRGLLRARST